MRSRSKVLLAFGAACLSTAVLASGAMAHDKHREKLGEISGKNSTALKVEVRGLITALTAPTAAVAAVGTTPAVLAAPGSITVTAGAGAGLTWTCAIAPGTDVSMFAATNRVKAKCRSTETGLVLTKLRHKDYGDKVKVEARGVATFTAATTTLPVAPATVSVLTGVLGQGPVVCTITDKTRMEGNPISGDMVKVECKSKDGVLTAKKIEKKVVKVKAKGVLAVTMTGPVATSVTVGTGLTAVTCAIPAGMTLPTGAVNGAFVEIKCLGTPPMLAKIEVEDGDDD